MSEDQVQETGAKALPNSGVSLAGQAIGDSCGESVPERQAPVTSASVQPDVVSGRKRRKVAPGILGSIQSLAGTIVIAVFVITFVVQAFQIPSESMENTLLIGDYLLVDKVHFSPGGAWSKVLPYETIRRGEVVVFRYPVHPSQHFVKRVVAVPGDRVRLYNKRAWVNGKPVNESYAVYHSEYRDPYRDNFPSGEHPSHIDPQWWRQMENLVEGGELIVPAGSYFVLGDNRDESLDSRYWGFVPRQNIVGRPLIVYFSMEANHGPFTRAEAASDKLTRFAQAFSSVVREIRWSRTMHLVQ